MIEFFRIFGDIFILSGTILGIVVLYKSYYK
jgi:hypothetical protein